MRYLAQEIECVAVGFVKVNPQTVERSKCVVGKAATPSGAATLPCPPTAFLANVNAFVVKQEILDMNHPLFPASSS